MATYGIAISLMLLLLSGFILEKYKMSKLRETKIVGGILHQKCTQCKKWLEATEEHFYFKNRGQNIIKASCKKCDRKNNKQYYIANKPKISNDHNMHRAQNKEKIKQQSKIYREGHKEKARTYQKEYRIQNKGKIKQYYLEYNKKNKERIEIQAKKYRLKNRKTRARYNIKYYKANKELLLKKSTVYAYENKGKIRKRKKKYHKRNKEKIKERTKNWYENNSVTVKEKHKEYRRSKAYFKTFSRQLTIAESPKDDGNGYMLVKCTYCGKYFYPTNMAVQGRVKSLLAKTNGEQRLYCSDGCKDACPIFNQQKWPKGFKPATSREVDPLIRQMCLERDDYTCQKCGKYIDEIEIHSHHIEGATQMPMLANDVDNTITLCKPCHKWVHKQPGCTYYDLRCKK